MGDSFAGAEGAIDQDKMAALNTLAQYGRRGLEEAALNKQRATSGATDLATANATVGHGFAGQYSQEVRDTLAGVGADSTQAYVRDSADAMSFLQGEQGVAGQVNTNYYDQARQAVPGIRSNAGAIQDQYKAAYDLRQADVVAQAQAAALAKQKALLEIQNLTAQAEQDQRIVALQAEQDRKEALLRAPVATRKPTWKGGSGRNTTPQWHKEIG